MLLTFILISKFIKLFIILTEWVVVRKTTNILHHTNIRIIVINIIKKIIIKVRWLKIFPVNTGQSLIQKGVKIEYL